ncbi:glycosyltransferase family 2 protein [Roseibium denhamense]|uniref:Glycosyltransferase, GT2 family n=1 Tax=Roseibium denhamense TaxID=76305 RepID=A0ABY1PNW5_9HYPH|nr:glycosyltransferase [Roseibium denhamense]MTI07008.1 glycosyltransferase family 2 protein [Roseibium denhamense]SMP36584.1 Glycosyltransferase, GT2 family [Roseibium denhamense]
MTQKLVIAVCTAQRPKMLEACLDALDQLIVPAETTISIVVVENDPEPFFTGDRAAKIRAGLKTALHFYHEQRKGIPFARNAALESALEHSPDWIALIDDDERAEPDWIEKLLTACEEHNAEVANGPVRRIYEQPPPHWWKSQLLKPRPTGTIITEAPTNNILMSSRLIADDGLGLRFDERLTFGSEDIDFFRRVHARGAKMIWVDDAFVEEDIPASRVTTNRLLSRMHMAATSGAFNIVLREGRLRAALHFIPKSVRRMFFGFLATVIGFLIKPFARKRGEKLYYYGLIRLMKGSGNLRGLMGRAHNYYDVIDGH